ncbi:MAG: hypothetical protein ACYTER_02540, partial [Planctomycetota bacterium]
MRHGVIAVGWLCMWMLSVTVNANVNGPDIDGDIAVWASDGIVYWDDLSDGIDAEPNQVPGYVTAAAPTVNGSRIVFEYDNGSQDDDLAGYDINDPSWPFPALANTNRNQRYPEICGSSVVWQDYSDTTTDPDIYMI